MTINVLHVWGPDIKTKYNGQYIFWKYSYGHWNDDAVCHTILDHDTHTIKPALALIEEKHDPSAGKISRFGRLWWALQLIWYLSKYKREYDILHVHILLWGGLLVAPFARLIGKPAFYESVLDGADNPSAVEKDKLGKIKLFCLRQYTKVIAISDALRRDFLKYKIPVAKLVNSVDIEMFSPPDSSSHKRELRRNLGIPEEAQVMLFVGSVKPRKGMDILVETFIRMAAKRPDLYLLIVGPRSVQENNTIDPKYVEEQYSLLDAHGLTERVTFTGMVEEKSKLAGYYKVSDVFVFPTRQEGLGNVILEAMASQLPVVVTHLPEIEDLIQHNKNGVFVPLDDIDGFVEAVSLLLDTPSFTREIAANAKEWVGREYYYEKWQSGLVNLYYEQQGM